MAGVGAESISALVSFLADIDRRGRIWNPPLHSRYMRLKKEVVMALKQIFALTFLIQQEYIYPNRKLHACIF